MKKARVHLFISGRVQGVFFRSSTKEKAKKIGVNGFVRNLADGRVEAVFEGKEDRIEKMVDWCRRGPIGVEVSKIEINWESYKGEFANFEIR